MQIEKYILLLIGVLFFGCQFKEDFKEQKQEKNIVKEQLDKIIIEGEEMGFVGNVRSVLEYEFDTNNSLDKIIRYKESFLFDKSGKLIKYIRFIENNGIYTEETVENYIFDNKENLIEWNHSGGDGKLDTQKKFSYDNKERLIETQEFHFQDLLTSKTDVSYFQDTIQFEGITTKRRDTTSTWVTKYNKYGELIENAPDVLKEFDKKGNLIKIRHERIGTVSAPLLITYDYDSNNNKVKETKYDSLNNVVETKIFYYNEKNKLIEEIIINSNGIEIRKFDKSGYVIFEYTSILNEEENRFYGFWRNFDKYGNFTKRVYMDDEKDKIVERVTRTELEYDKMGNWISKREYQ